MYILWEQLLLYFIGGGPYFAINLKIQQLLIVPLINGKMLNKAAYHLPVVTLLSTKEPHEMNFALQLLPDEIIEQLEQSSIFLHEGEEITLARSLMEQMANIHAIVAHIYDLVSIPEIEDDDVEAIQAYITRTFAKLSDVINKVIHQLEEATELLNNFTFANSANQDLANDTLQLLKANLLSDEMDDDGRIQLEKLAGWRNQLVNALGAAFALCTVIASEM